MRFLNREDELGRLEGLMDRGGGLAVIWGRRRIGKTRLLVEWARRHGGAYTVADHSAPAVQRRYFAESLAQVLPGFADVEYRDWRSLLSRLAREAKAVAWRGPLIFDELPYLVVSSPDLPAILQRWVDHEAQDLVVALAGSSQHMMQGLTLDASAPLFGRAQELFELRPLRPGLLREMTSDHEPLTLLQAWTAWGGVPRYWELSAGAEIVEALDRLVFDPLGPLHHEPDRLIAEELPPAREVRALLDAIGNGAHRVSEIGGRLGRPATALQRPLQRLQTMGLVRREVPFDEDERSSKRSLYRISDPFTRLWFRLVAPHRGPLATATPQTRAALLRSSWPQLMGEAWEDLCREQLPKTTIGGVSWGPGARWWHGQAPEWDIVARAVGGDRILLGECKVSAEVAPAARRLASRQPPPLRGADRADALRVLFVAACSGVEVIEGVLVVGGDVMLR